MAAPLSLIELEPAELAEQLEAGEILLVDVREPHEFDAVRIEGAVPFPLSTFDPAALPDSNGKPIVFQCASGVRSAHAVEVCQMLGLPHARHLRGGIQAWRRNGLPTIS